MKPTKRETLAAEDKGVGKASGLAVIWLKILSDLGIKYESWSSHMNHYLNDPANGIANDSKTRSTAKGNLEKRLFSGSKVSWSMFCRGLKVLSYSLKRVRFIIEIETNRGEKFQVTHDLITPKEEQRARRRKF